MSRSMLQIYCDEPYDWEKGRGMYEKGRSETARYLVRMYALLLTRNVEKIYWYLLRDHMDFKMMGLLRKPDDALGRYAVAPACPAYATLIRQLEGADFVRREAVRPYTRAYVLLFRRGDQQVRVCWATHPAKIEIKADTALAVVDIMGVEQVGEPQQDKVILSLDENPVYVNGNVEDVAEVVAGPEIVGGSSHDYSKTQGKNNWFYGYYNGDDQGDGTEVRILGEEHLRNTVWRWRRAFQNDFAARMDWCVKPNKSANHPPVAGLGGKGGTEWVRLEVKAGAELSLNAASSSDPDGDKLSYRWYVYPEAEGYGRDIAIRNSTSQQASLTVPGDESARQTIHVILEVTDDGDPPLTRYRRIILDVVGPNRFEVPSPELGSTSP